MQAQLLPIFLLAKPLALCFISIFGKDASVGTEIAVTSRSLNVVLFPSFRQFQRNSCRHAISIQCGASSIRDHLPDRVPDHISRGIQLSV